MLRALSHEIRLCVVALLSQKEEQTVSEMLELIECEQSLLSHHLRDMRAKGIVDCRRCGKHAFYSLKDRRATQLLRCISQTS